MVLKLIQCVLLQTLLLVAFSSSKSEAVEPMIYRVQRAEKSFKLEDQWNQGQWAEADEIQLNHYMGKKPEHFPKTQVKLLYDESHIYIFFRVGDRYVRAVANEHQDSVCVDSCVEFFFTPSEDIRLGYFNVEINCGGTLLFHHQTARGKNQRQVAVEDYQKIEILPSMPKTVDPEIAEPTLWTLKYALPVDILKKYTPVKKPAPGVTWKANFYKCADKTSHPHWLTWNPIDWPTPNFHLPQYFGTLVFE